jgi:hypothetical protein
MWRKRDSFVRKPLILRELLNFKFTRLVELALKRRFGSFDMQTRYSDSASTIRSRCHSIIESSARKRSGRSLLLVDPTSPSAHRR